MAFRNSIFGAGLIALFLLLISVRLWSSDVTITYLANEGVLIECQGNRLLVDALLRDSLDAYARHSPQVQEELETGKSPFDNIGLALATHFHLDHWDAGSIARFLRNNPDAVFASTPQATAMLPWSLRERVRALWPGTDSQEQIDAGGFTVKAFPLEHGTTQNLGYRISVCGKTLVHLGDAEASGRDFDAVIKAGPVDIAMVPFWWLLDSGGVAFIRNKWNPPHLVALHFATNDMDAAKKVQVAWPDVWVCTKQLEIRKF